MGWQDALGGIGGMGLLGKNFGFGDNFGFGRKKSSSGIPGYEKFSTLSPEQQSLLDQLLPFLQGQLGEEGAGKFGAPYERKFREETIPGIAERFSGLGAGSQSSSAFQQSLGQAGASLSEQLASMGDQRQNNILNQLLNILGGNFQGAVPEQKGFLQEFLLSMAPAAGKAATGAFFL